MRTQDDVAVAAGDSVDLAVWRAMFDGLMGRVAPRFFRVETRRRVARFVSGLLSELPTKNGWTLAEHAGEASPDGMQRLLNKAVWDHDGVRDDVRDFVIEQLADPDAVLAIDETGDVKKGTDTVGVQRQYTGTAGRIENCQVAVYCSYVTAGGHTPIDGELYLPQSWFDDPGRLARAGVPAQVEFATKPALAARMLHRTIEAGVPFGWVAGDEVYGQSPELRHDLEQASLGYVLAVASNHRIDTGHERARVDVLARTLHRSAWHTYSAGDGAKGQRLYHWAWIQTSADQPDRAGHRWLLIRRNRSTGELAYYRCYAPHRVSLPTLIRVAGRRWPIETDFQTSKGQTGLDEHQVRLWISWRRWMILVILAHALLAVLAATARQSDTKHRATTGLPDDELIPLTVPEIRRLLAATIIQPIHDLIHRLHWSHWRRRAQARAKRSHYQRQQARDG